jgi:uncharacterized protein YkwD
VKYNTLSHQFPGEASLGDRIRAEGFPAVDYSENVAYGFCDAQNTHNQFMNSPLHQANIMKPNMNAAAVSSLAGGGM